MGFLSNIFGFKSVDYKSLSKAGAIIIDVRTSSKFGGGHIKGSKNIELQQLKNHLNKIPKDIVIITCCASGMRSASAKSILLQNGFFEVHNGGGWKSLKK